MSSLRLAFLIHGFEILNHYSSIIDSFENKPDILCSVRKNDSDYPKISSFAKKKGCILVSIFDVGDNFMPYDAVISHHTAVIPEGAQALGHYGKRQIRMMYSLGDFQWMFAEWNTYYDAILCYGPYQQKMFAHLFPNIKTVGVGYPRLDVARQDEIDRRAISKAFGCDSDKKIVLWLPTVGEACSLASYYKRVADLGSRFTVLVKPHPLTIAEEPELINTLKETKNIYVIDDTTLNNAVLIMAADYVLADYGGSPFAAIYFDKNICLLNMVGDILMDLIGPFSPEIELRKYIVNINPGDDRSLENIIDNQSIWEEQKLAREIYREQLFADVPVGEAGKRAADAIVQFASTPINSNSRVNKSAKDLPIESFNVIPPGKLEQRFTPGWYDWQRHAQWGSQRIGKLREERIAVDKKLHTTCTELHAAYIMLEEWKNMRVIKFSHRRIKRYFKEIIKSMKKRN